jgi:hypothetical protein
MSKDVERLFRNINQAGLPYQVFEPPSVPSPAIGHAEPEALAPEPTTWPLHPTPRAARSKVFRKYLVNVEAQPAVGTPLKPIFDRMREKCRAATKA